MKRILFLFVIGCASLVSCKKNLKEAIIGTWEVSSFSSPESEIASKLLLEQIEKSEKSTSLEFVNDSILNIITPDGKFEAQYELNADSSIQYQLQGISTYSLLGKFDGKVITKEEVFKGGQIHAEINFLKKKD